MTKKGLFVAIEGIDGCGKSTFTSLLKDLLSKKIRAEDVVMVSTFGQDSWGKHVRSLIVGDNELTKEHLSPMLTDLHTHNFFKYVKPALSAGKIVIIDRSIYSTLVFQHTGSTVETSDDYRIYMQALKECRSYLLPDLLLLLDIDPATARKRLALRNDQAGYDRVEAQDLQTHESYRQDYLTYATSDLSDKSIIIDNNSTPEQLAARSRTISDLIVEIAYNC